MFDFIRNLFSGPATTQDELEDIKLLEKHFETKTLQTKKQFLTEKELPAWADEVVSYNCGWDEKRKGYMLLVTVTKTSEKIS
jgi:hypothetical protein